MMPGFILTIEILYLTLIHQANHYMEDKMIKHFFARRINPFLLTLFALFTMPAHAVLEIDITEGVIGGIPIAIVPFQNS